MLYIVIPFLKIIPGLMWLEPYNVEISLKHSCVDLANSAVAMYFSIVTLKGI